jgi:hypothetical protein
MTACNAQPIQPLAADGPAMTRILQRARVGRDSVIRVTGPAGATAILWLSRHGYERAAYVHSHWVATVSPADALLIPQTCTAQDLAELLQGGDCVREGGVLIVQAPPARSALPGDSVPTLLQSRGYQVQDHVSERGRDVYIARRIGVSGLKQAA